MSNKTKMLKDQRRRIGRLKDEARKQIALEILMLPLWQRLKFAKMIVFRTKNKQLSA